MLRNWINRLLTGKWPIDTPPDDQEPIRNREELVAEKFVDRHRIYLSNGDTLFIYHKGELVAEIYTLGTAEVRVP